MSTAGWRHWMGNPALTGFRPIDIDVSFEEFLKNLEWYFAALGELGCGRLRIVADFFSTDISDDINLIEEGVLAVKMGGDIAIATLMGESGSTKGCPWICAVDCRSLHRRCPGSLRMVAAGGGSRGKAFHAMFRRPTEG